MRRIDELERSFAGFKNELGEKEKVIRAHKLQIEEMSMRNKDSISGVRNFFVIYYSFLIILFKNGPSSASFLFIFVFSNKHFNS